MSRRIEKFVPILERDVRGYVCGPTPYDSMHVGHARTYSFFDTFVKFLRYIGYNVTLVINFTDIDDKIINRAREEFGSEAYIRWREIPERYIREFFEICEKLNIGRADHYPKVTEHIDDMIASIRTLISRGYAYVAPDGSVYFEIEKVPEYGKLSGQDISKLMAGARVEPEPGKKNPLDFALWKSWKPGEPWWSTPWCPGRPGWHLECVVMASKYLGVPFDFHGGGLDLVFPHHENELAIGYALYGSYELARYWIHVGLVTIHGEKMSKSLKNIIPVHEVLKRYDGEVLRLYYSMTHYRKPLDFSYEGLSDAEQLLRTLYAACDYLRELYREARDEAGPEDPRVVEDVRKVEESFLLALADDMDTPRAVSELISLARMVTSKLIYMPEKISKDTVSHALHVLISLGNILGVLTKTTIDETLFNIIELTIEVRQRLRRQRNFELADYIREELSRQGVIVTDTRVRTYWTLDRFRQST
ncbi:MAG: cysteine--tRNA ligase [Crenarchaeota archaeon]|nr:cysteine--tRNA ligase [Thermoproteota archaeon]